MHDNPALSCMNQSAHKLQVYLRHVFGSRDFLQGEGAEYRGSWDDEPAVAPYFSIINGSDFATEESR